MPPAQAFRTIRVFRVLQLIPQLDSLYSLLRILWFSLPQLASMIELFMMIFYVYARAGASLFADVKYGQFINEFANYKSVTNAMMLHFRLITGENWNGIMSDCLVQPPDCTEGVDCGSVIAIPFFVSSVIVGTYLMLSVFVAVILDNFKSVTREQDSMSHSHLQQFCELWRDFARVDSPHVRSFRSAVVVLRR